MSLTGKTILITRPIDQTQGLQQLVQQASGQAVVFPLLSIRPEEQETIALALNDIQNYDKVIFISRNAVNISMHYLQNTGVQLKNDQCIPIGQATLAALRDFGYEGLYGESGLASTENILQQEFFAPEMISGESVLIIRGSGGRETLKEELQARGATVRYADVYNREKVAYSLQEKQEIILSEPDVIVLTSNEGIDACYECFYDIEPGFIQSAAIVVLSERNKEHARNLGFKGGIKVAEQTSDQGLLNACIQLVN